MLLFVFSHNIMSGKDRFPIVNIGLRLAGTKFHSFMKTIGLIFIFLIFPLGFAHGDELAVIPESPSVEASGNLQLSVTGASGTIIWTAAKGQIAGQGATAVYTAPGESGVDFVMVVSGESVALVEITILPGTSIQIPVSLENAVWEIFTNRSWIMSLAWSDDGNTLWAGTGGGLEKRDANSGRIIRFFTRSDGLPDNRITAVATIGQSVWVGTEFGGLAQLNENGTWRVLDADNSGLPDNHIFCLLPDGSGGLWIGTETGGLARLFEDSSWRLYTLSNSGIPDNEVRFLSSDQQGGLWVGTENGGLAHLDSAGQWTVLDTTNSQLPNAAARAVVNDGAGGIWIGTWGGLARLWSDGTWTIYNETNSSLPDNRIRTLAADEEGGLWIGTHFGGLAYLATDGHWERWNVENSTLPYDEVTNLLINAEGGLLVGTFEGLCRMTRSGNLEVLNAGGTSLPYNYVQALSSDGFGGIWAGTLYGLGHRDANGAWTLYYEEGQLGASLPSHDVRCLVPDGSGGIWAGTYSGISHLSANGAWAIYNTDNSDLPENDVVSMAQDGSGGIWAGTMDGGLVQLSYDGRLDLMDTDNSGLPDDRVNAVLSDEQGGVWAGTMDGLGRLSADGSWKVYRTDNSDLPCNDIRSLAPDESGGVWVGTLEGGLAHLLSNGVWEVFPASESGLPNDTVWSLAKDENGGLWVGTIDGLGHRKADGTWTVFTLDNSGIPDTDVHALLPDGSGGVWVGTWGGGLGRLSFGEKQEILQSVTDSQTRESILTGSRAAILVHPRGGTGYEQDVSIEFMASYAYRVLLARGYDNDEIYFLSHKPDVDINGDGMADQNVVDGPVTWLDLGEGMSPRDITLSDIRSALEWAENRGALSQPLLFIFTDHGLPNSLRLDPFDELLQGSELSELLYQYQLETGNSVIMMLEACHSGTLMDELAGENRIIITSTGEDLAYYDNLGMISFSRLFFSLLKTGASFYDAFSLTTTDLPGFGFPFDQQRPGLDDNGDGSSDMETDGLSSKELCLNGCWGGLSGDISLEPRVQGKTVGLNESVELSVKAGTTGGEIQRVWAVIKTPETALQRDEQGYSLIPEPVVHLSKTDDSLWTGSFSGFEYRGEYVATFMAKDNDGFVYGSTPVIFTVREGPEPLQTQCLTVSDDLSIPVSCAMYSGNAFAFVLRLNRASDLTWFLDMETFELTEESGNGCISIQPDLSFTLPCVTCNGANYNLDFNFLETDEWIWQAKM